MERGPHDRTSRSLITEAHTKPRGPAARPGGQARCPQPICLSSLPRSLPSCVPMWMKPTAGDFRTPHHGEVMLAPAPGLEFPISQPDTPNVRALSALSPVWSYITLAGASHASPPSHLDTNMRREQDRMILAERMAGMPRTPGPSPSQPRYAHMPSANGVWHASVFSGLSFPISSGNLQPPTQ